MAQYLILIYGDEARWDARSDDEKRAVDAAHGAFRERGGSAIVASGELESSRMATTLRAGGERPLVTDGPSSRRRSSSAASTSSTCPTWTRPWASPDCCTRPPRATAGVQVHPLVDHS